MLANSWVVKLFRAGLDSFDSSCSVIAILVSLGGAGGSFEVALAAGFMDCVAHEW